MLDKTIGPIKPLDETTAAACKLLAEMPPSPNLAFQTNRNES